MFAVFAFTAGMLAGSVALVADSFHMVIDVSSASVLAWVITLRRRPASERSTFAYHQADVLMAQTRDADCAVMAVVTAWEGVHCVAHVAPADGSLVSIAAAVGIVASLGILAMLRRTQPSTDEGERTGRANWLHELRDHSDIVSAAVAGLLITVTHSSR